MYIGGGKIETDSTNIISAETHYSGKTDTYYNYIDNDVQFTTISVNTNTTKDKLNYPRYIKDILSSIKDFLNIDKDDLEFSFKHLESALANIWIPFTDKNNIEFDEDNITIFISEYIEKPEEFTISKYYKNKFKEKDIEYSEENMIKMVILHELGHYFDFKNSDKKEFHEKHLEHLDLVEELQNEDYDDNHFEYYDRYFNLPLEKTAQEFAYRTLKTMNKE